MSKKGRSFIIDYGCCLPYGHNLHAVNLYKRKEEARGKKAIAIVCKRVKSFHNKKQEGFYFLLPTLHKGLIIEAIDNFFIRLYMKLIRIILLFPFIGKNNILTIKGANSMKKLFKTLDINLEDTIIYPSADYYGTKALLKTLSKLKVEDQPKVHLRFIGSLETPHSFSNHHLPELIDLMQKNPHNLSVSAEVPIYARYLNSLIPNINVTAAPFPIEEKENVEKKEISKNNKNFTILLPGSNRADKGYFETYYLVKEILYEFPSVKVIIQDMKKQNKFFNKKYQNKLQNLANVKLKEAVLAKEEILEMYNEADLILLPYDPNVYHLRGSGIHYEAIENRIPVLAKKGVGFAEEIEEWFSGWLYETKQDLLQHLKKIMTLSSKEKEEQMHEAYRKYKKSSDEAYPFNLS
tara:strand:- start:2164 stop:3384 length:1221 start_codon:yes stop_codon:yes gene_type:complete